MKLKLLFAGVFTVSLLIALTTAVLAQEQPPPPYAGLKNPFPWDSTSAQAAGKKLYQQSCLGCHGVKGNNLPASDFSSADFPKSLENRTDYYFWILSEGRLDKGMPLYKSTLSEEQRWQVLTYLWSLGKQAVPKEIAPPARPPATEDGGTLQLVADQAGQLLILTATLQDSQDKPVENATIKFFIKKDFFARGLMEIGEAITDSKGVAVFEYAPRHASEIEVVARHNTMETLTTVTLPESDNPVYQAEAGIQLPTLGEEVFIGPESAHGLGEMGEAPTSALRLPGGILSWLLLPAIAVVAIWAVYFRVMYQILRIPVLSRVGETNLRLVPLVGMAIIAALGILLALKIVTGPYSHFHLIPIVK